MFYEAEDGRIVKIDFGVIQTIKRNSKKNKCGEYVLEIYPSNTNSITDLSIAFSSREKMDNCYSKIKQYLINEEALL